MKRITDQELIKWSRAERRKPLLLRGARQVGKTYAVEVLAREAFGNQLVKIDFEKMPLFAKIFAPDLNVKRIVGDLEFAIGVKIIPGKTLLFFDEIQQCPEAIMSLRYFYEEFSELHVIAAGSLLEFVLSEIPFPVGRVQCMNIYPMGFVEFLMALGRENLAELIQQKPHVLSDTAHHVLRQELYRYFIVGGMPEAVSTYVHTKSIRESQLVHQELINGFRNDFAKYAPRANPMCLNEVFSSVAKEVGKKIQYSHLAQDFSGPTIKQAFQLLNMAQVITEIPACHPPVLPLGASVHHKTFKAIMLDIGLMQSLCGLPMNLEDLSKNLLSIYRGALAEQFVAQELRLVQDQGKLYYWHRPEKSSSAEVDYLAIKNNQVIPVEVKSGASGRLRSLHMMLQQYPDSPYGFIFLDAPYQEPSDPTLIFMPLYYVYAAFVSA